MSLRRIKTLYCVAVISIGILLASHGEVVSWAASIIVLGGALPMFGAIRCAMANWFIDRSYEHRRAYRATRQSPHEETLTESDLLQPLHESE